MPESKIVKIGDKTFKVRKGVPYQIIDLALAEYAKLEKIEEEGDRALASLKLRSLLMTKMVLEPKIDTAYFENEAELEEVELSFDLLADTFEAINERFNIIKKKHPKLFDIKPGEQESDGLKKTLT